MFRNQFDEEDEEEEEDDYVFGNKLSGNNNNTSCLNEDEPDNDEINRWIPVIRPKSFQV